MIIIVWIFLFFTTSIIISFISLRIISKEGEDGRIIRPDSKLSDEFIEELELVPGGKKIKECIQCGICSASCPVAFAMDYTPRQIWELLRSGQLRKALDSHTVWLCSSCYKCAVRCSTGIPFTDVMYGLKRLGVEKNLNKKGLSGPVWSKTFLNNVRRYERINDIAVMIQFMLKRQPFRIFTIIPESLKMLSKRRIPLLKMLGFIPKTFNSFIVKSDIKTMLDWIDENVDIGGG
ncbi:MAG: 4Fe-4S dicluster domain-containing protein [Candidatus Heimdallarchaeaceae archaeon]